ncbi:ElyC/SanA/YdcF family protein [Paractinoplanes globisporus]|uniref:ElyC/SanA/YdcF family protein n=1 Tax=Paractinoplanes globisporus TaxID=113565 RepID=A0ABW6W3F0_9ACTN|nr:ElyC/SanA/YdcF family protein [Actinoplanes globisporus]
MSQAAWSVNTLVRFCARRDVAELTPAALGGVVDVAILFGGSILAGADVFAAAMRAGAARRYLIVGGQGHTTDALRRAMGSDDSALTEAALFDRYLRRRYGLAVDLLEQESTNCGNNVTNALAVLRAEGVRHEWLVLVQDATMQQRMDAGFRRQTAPSTRIVNYAAHRTLVDDALAYVDPPAGMWPLDRYVSLLLGEVRRLTDDANGYGPAGRGFIAHVDVPAEVRLAAEHLSAGFTARVADARWAG